MTSAILIPNVPKKVEVLAVSGDETELDSLRCLFAGSSWGFRTARTLTEVLEWLSVAPRRLEGALAANNGNGSFALHCGRSAPRR